MVNEAAKGEVVDRETDEMVEVLVPRKHLMAVYGYVAALEQGKADVETPVSAPPDGPTDDPTGPDDDEDWSPRQLRLLYDQSPPAMIRILDYLAENPDREVPSDEVMEAIAPGASANRLAGTLGAFGRRVKNRYQRDSWPFDAYYSHEYGRVVYVMNPWIAEKLRGFKAA